MHGIASALRTLALAAATVLLGSGLTLLTAHVVYANRVLPNTHLAGVELGGLTMEEARSRIEAVAQRMATERVAVTHEGTTWIATYEQLGVGLDVPAVLAQAAALGHGSFLASVNDWVGAVSGGVALVPARRTGSSALDEILTASAELWDRAPVDGAVHVSTAGIMTEPSVAGRQLDRDGLRRAVLAAGIDGRTITATLRVVEPAITQAEVDRVLALAEAATRPLTLVLDGQALVIPIERVRALVYVAAEDDQLVLRWPDTTMNLVVMMAMERFDRPAVSADPGQDDTVVDTDRLRFLIGQSVGWEGEERVITVPVW